MFPDYQNSIRCNKEGNHPKPRRTSHDLAHSTGLPKPPGYNLEWPCVTPLQDALVIGPPTKASAPKSPGAHLMPLGEIWFQTAWRASRTAKRQAPNRSLAVPSPLGAPISRRQAPNTFQAFCFTIPSSETNPTAMCPAHTVTTATVLRPYRLAASRQAPYQ